MLQLAYLARRVSEDPFHSIDYEFKQYQENNPQSTSYSFNFSSTINVTRMQSIALHFSDAGYDVFCVSPDRFLVDWTSAEQGRTGSINIHNAFLTFTKDASQK
ncbi:MAG: hypothetical protein HFJ28_06385 [Clostridia bacterium]|nr:hypothetical protein [Clostridia bacterium]